MLPLDIVDLGSQQRTNKKHRHYHLPHGCGKFLFADGTDCPNKSWVMLLRLSADRQSTVKPHRGPVVGENAPTRPILGHSVVLQISRVCDAARNSTQTPRRREKLLPLLCITTAHSPIRPMVVEICPREGAPCHVDHTPDVTRGTELLKAHTETVHQGQSHQASCPVVQSGLEKARNPLTRRYRGRFGRCRK